jgi:hemerythrin
MLGDMRDIIDVNSTEALICNVAPAPDPTPSTDAIKPGDSHNISSELNGMTNQEINTALQNGDLVWSDAMLLGFTPMDDRHMEFVQCVTRLRGSNSAEVIGAMDAMLQHLIAHFDEEHRWMVESAFPSTDCHVDEHNAVMESARQVYVRVHECRDVAEAHRFADALAGWFPGHADYLDSALSHWLSKIAYGGRPVVLRRGLIKSGDGKSETSTE